MKKLVAFILALTLCVCLFGCKAPQTHNDFFETKGIKQVTVKTAMEDPSYSFSGSKARKVVEYLAGLKLTTNFNEDSSDLYGYVWHISIEYENGDTAIWYHIANTFLRSKDGTTYKMDHEEAHRFETLLEELDS